ncbi:hypothetical protein D9Q98_007498 [Chlorella vulgaris]|uniref:Elongator complex protein 5 n=1 Tax=Chlorella vulgaris TaxID=3077 RepID=A0A9D4TM67_CHLVU|nr:hypothetical protein D9Q98_007498 [Chlorella vulgaris]
MDLAVRTLREGIPDGGDAAPLLLLCDALAVIGGPALLRQALADMTLAIAGRRAQAIALTLVALERPAAQYHQLCSPSLGTFTVLDCFSDPYGWGGLLAVVPAGGSSSNSTISVPSILAAPNGLDRLLQLLSSTSTIQSAGAGARHCIVFDSLTPLVDRFGGAAVVQLLHRLQRLDSTSSLLCGLHTDLHAPQLLAALEQLAAGTLQLSAASELEQTLCAAMHGSTPQGRLSARLKRRSGRVRVQTQLYCLDAADSVRISELPTDALNPQAALEKGTVGTAGGSSGGEAALAQQLAGGMKLGLSAAELEAKQRVQLPFEHQGHAAAYKTGDFRDYLPPEAGGRAAARPASAAGGAAAGAAGGAGAGTGAGGGEIGVRQGLGHILYVRDSGSEHDSDEDPDDDLDI